MKERTVRFLIVAGAITAFGLPFALAFPQTLLLKLAAVGALLAVACGIAAGAMRMKGKDHE